MTNREDSAGPLPRRVRSLAPVDITVGRNATGVTSGRPTVRQRTPSAGCSRAR